MKILKNTNDRTWCFWDEKDTTWQNAVSKKWDFAIFSDNKHLDLFLFLLISI
jgi:lycopene beta-cyclase